jgi:DNA primase
VIEVAPGDDPDTFIRREGSAAFLPLLEKSTPIFEFFYRGLSKTLDMHGVEGKVAFVNEVVPRLLKIADPLERGLYEKEICRTVGIEQGMLRKKMGVIPSTPRPKATPPRRGVETEEVLLTLMVKFPEVVEKVRQHLPERLFGAQHLGFAKAILAQAAQGVVDLPLILEQLESQEERGRLFSLFVEDAHLEDMDALKAFEQCRQNLERGALKGGGKALARELATLDPDSPRYLEILADLEGLRNKKSKLL